MLVSGKKHGEWRHYFESGVISIIIIYEHGVKKGKSYWFHPNGNIGWEENYIQGIPHGKFLYYDEKGQLRIERVFEKGKEESYIFDGKELKKKLNCLALSLSNLYEIFNVPFPILYSTSWSILFY